VNLKRLAENPDHTGGESEEAEDVMLRMIGRSVENVLSPP